MAHGAGRAFESLGAVGEAFNVAAPTPFSFPEGAEILAGLTDQEPFEVRLPVQWRYDLDPTKARSWIGYQPRGDLRTAISSALRFREGQREDYDW